MANNPKADTGLLEGVRRGDIAEVRRHLAAGANPDAVDANGRSGLWLAASLSMSNFRRKEILQELAKFGADVNKGDAQGSTPLHEAAVRADWDTMKFLKDRGANVNAPDKNGATPLHAAMYAAMGTGKTETMKLLLDMGANSLLRDKAGQTALDRAREKEGFTLFYATVISFLSDWERDKPKDRRNREYDAATQDEQRLAANDTLQKLKNAARANKPKFKP